MNLQLDRFCEIVKTLNKSNAEKALAVLWYFDIDQNAIARSSGQLTKVLTDHHVATPNQTSLAEAIRKTKLASESKAGFYLKPGSRNLIRGWLPQEIDGIQPAIDHKSGYLQESVWTNTRGYIEEVCRELNGCISQAYYNAAAVLLRRLLETLIIEAYEHLNRENEIKDGSGNYYLLSDLADRATAENGHKGLNLGRDSKKALKEARNIGNWSAHARRYLAKPEDLTKLQVGARLTIQELILIAEFNKKKS